MGRLLRVTFDETRGGTRVGDVKATFSSELKIDCSGNRTASISTNQAQVSITNISRELRDHLSDKYRPINNQINNQDGLSGRIVIEAGNDASGYSQVFEGGVIEVRTGSPPDIVTTFTVVSNDRYKGVASSWSFGSVTTISQLTNQIAGVLNLAPNLQLSKAEASYTIVNAQLDGVSADLPRLLDQIPGVSATVDKGVLSVRPSFEKVGGQSVIKVNKDTGMIGTPRFLDSGIEVTILFNPDISVNSLIKTSSQLVPGTNGVWKVVNIFFELHNREAPFYYTLKCLPVYS